ncbi:nucleotidyltransferase family protein [Oceanobacillus damuensis]|uniref:nucleotidyltransferase family protein n=1 Tax=Oceanobacillus damuensis TaxID=937928 RepID=UPI000833152D|nr:nucleotidyltransferase family protein [Oceanobacillus damuensis]
MNLETEKDIIQLISNDSFMMEILTAASTLRLPDWSICAGFVRSKIWDELHGYGRTSMPDIDVVYFDKNNINEGEEKRLEKLLAALLPDVPWSVKNEARMHVRNDINPYLNTEDAISKFPETCTALGVYLDKNEELHLIAPHGIQDVLAMIVRPTPLFNNSSVLMKVYEQRIRNKKWHLIWDMVTYAVKTDEGKYN